MKIIKRKPSTVRIKHHIIPIVGRNQEKIIPTISDTIESKTFNSNGVIDRTTTKFGEGIIEQFTPVEVVEIIDNVDFNDIKKEDEEEVSEKPKKSKKTKKEDTNKE